MADVERLLGALQTLVDQGNTVAVIEHNTDVIKVADHIIDLGPEGGEGGGQLVGEGTPETIASLETPTSQVLREALATEPAPQHHASKRPAQKAQQTDIVLKGVHTHNLQHIDITIPKEKMTVVTGVSGSGKTSLAFDTLFSEGQRRYVESLSTYARRFLGRAGRAP